MSAFAYLLELSWKRPNISIKICRLQNRKLNCFLDIENLGMYIEIQSCWLQMMLKDLLKIKQVAHAELELCHPTYTPFSQHNWNNYNCYSSENGIHGSKEVWIDHDIFLLSCLLITFFLIINPTGHALKHMSSVYECIKYFEDLMFFIL